MLRSQFPYYVTAGKEVQIYAIYILPQYSFAIRVFSESKQKTESLLTKS